MVKSLHYSPYIASGVIKSVMSVVKSTFLACGWINGRKCGFSRMFVFQRELFMFMHIWHALFVRRAPSDLHVYNSRCSLCSGSNTLRVYTLTNSGVMHWFIGRSLVACLVSFMRLQIFLSYYQMNVTHLAQNVLCEFEWAEMLLYCIYTHFYMWTFSNRGTAFVYDCKTEIVSDSMTRWGFVKCTMNQLSSHDDKQVLLYLSLPLLRASSSLSAEPVFERRCLCDGRSPELIWLCLSGWIHWSSVWEEWVKHTHTLKGPYLHNVRINTCDYSFLVCTSNLKCLFKSCTWR